MFTALKKDTNLFYFNNTYNIWWNNSNRMGNLIFKVQKNQILQHIQTK